jgi:ATP/maltotriose-dependent transcriptional regulator MalT
MQGYKTETYKNLNSSFCDEIGSNVWVDQFFKEVLLLATKNRKMPVIVLDDMHNLHNHTIITSIARLLRFLTFEMGVVLISREQMPKAIKSLNISNTNVELTAQDLAFTNDHCLAYAQTVIKHEAINSIDPHFNASLNEKVVRLFNQTDGWPVFACFAINRLISGGVEAEHENNLNVQDDISSYLEQHIFDNLSVEMKDTLIALAPYSAVNKAFYQDCLVLPIEFDQFIKTNGLLTNSNVVPCFIRLREPLRQLLLPLWLDQNPNIKSEIFNKSYKWYLESKMIIEAILLCIERSHWLMAINLIEKETEFLLASGRSNELCAQFNIIPEELVNNRPVLLIFMARYFYHQVTHLKVTHYVDQASSSISKDTAGALPDEKYIHRSKEQILSDISQLKHWIGGLLNEGSSGYDAPKVEIRAQCSDDQITAGLMCGLYYLSIGKIPKAQGLLQSALKKALTGRNQSVLSKSIIALGWVCYLTGEYTVLHTILGSLKATLSNADRAIFAVAHQSNWIMILTLLERGNISQADQLLQESLLHKNMKDSPMDVQFESLIMQVILKIEFNQFEEAEKIFENLDILSFELPSAVQQCFFSIPALKSEMYLKQNCLEKALLWVNNFSCPDSDKNTIRYQYESLIKADVLVAQGQFIEAFNVLAFLKKAAEKSGNQIILMKAYISEALAYESRHEQVQALESFHQAIQLGSQMGSVTSFLRDKTQMTCLLGRAKVAFNYPTYIVTLMAALNNNVEDSSKGADKIMLTTLSKREREVLALMAKGNSNPEIASSLCRSLGTIKIHVHNIYKKLGVSNRVTALNKYHSA